MTTTLMRPMDNMIPMCLLCYAGDITKGHNYDRTGSRTVLQLGFEGRRVSGRALFTRSYENEGTMCHAMCLVSRHVTIYIPIPQ